MTAYIPDPLEIDPRPCILCGGYISDHEMIDDGNGPLFFCEADDAPADIVRWEMDDPRDRWRHTGEPPPPIEVRNGPAPEPARQSNRPAQSTIAAFLYLVSLKDPDRLVAWLQERERDRPFLLTLLEAK